MTPTRQSRHPSPLAPAPVTVTRRSFGSPLRRPGHGHPPLLRLPAGAGPGHGHPPLLRLPAAAGPVTATRRSFGSPLPPAPVTATRRSFGSPLPPAAVTATAAWDALYEAGEDEAEWDIVTASAGIGPGAR